MGHGVCSDGSDKGGFGHTCETVHAREDVTVICGGWQGYDSVKVDVVKSHRDGRQGAMQRGCRVTLDV